MANNMCLYVLEYHKVTYHGPICDIHVKDVNVHILRVHPFRYQEVKSQPDSDYDMRWKRRGRMSEGGSAAFPL